MKLKLSDYNDSDLLRILREWSGLTQEELAKKIGKNKRSIYDYEAGIYTFNMVTLRKIMKELDLEITIDKKKH